MAQKQSVVRTTLTKDMGDGGGWKRHTRRGVSNLRILKPGPSIAEQGPLNQLEIVLNSGK